MNSTKINYIVYGLAILSSIIAGLQVVDWTAFLTKDQTIAIMGGLNTLGVMIKGWMATAELMAKQMAGASK
ncbi:hypothetical protein [Rhizobium favelukesii]|uniref:Uncharacterized protein n=1 Tax=Rhizobium favelukesii TaxID=348824 RepID=W6RA05_9HYPH|nr:hypothetical protein [Rhizobium favelukesii]MCS0459963.1 hypothetical protein [Rhizobium favelukesii]CDM57210.1 hypothetical protein LPU83_1538 [Rhizobium favelukesii]